MLCRFLISFLIQSIQRYNDQGSSKRDWANSGVIEFFILISDPADCMCLNEKPGSENSTVACLQVAVQWLPKSKLTRKCCRTSTLLFEVSSRSVSTLSTSVVWQNEQSNPKVKASTGGWTSPTQLNNESGSFSKPNPPPPPHTIWLWRQAPPPPPPPYDLALTASQVSHDFWPGLYHKRAFLFLALVLSSSRFTRGLCLRLRFTCKPVFSGDHTWAQ